MVRDTNKSGGNPKFLCMHIRPPPTVHPWKFEHSSSNYMVKLCLRKFFKNPKKISNISKFSIFQFFLDFFWFWAPGALLELSCGLLGAPGALLGSPGLCLVPVGSRGLPWVPLAFLGLACARSGYTGLRSLPHSHPSPLTTSYHLQHPISRERHTCTRHTYTDDPKTRQTTA